MFYGMLPLVERMSSQRSLSGPRLPEGAHFPVFIVPFIFRLATIASSIISPIRLRYSPDFRRQVEKGALYFAICRPKNGIGPIRCAKSADEGANYLREG